MSRSAVVLGASGFIGTRLVKRLAERGLQVRAVDILAPRERMDGVEYLNADVRKPLAQSLGEGASAIYNLAAVHRTPGHPDHEYYDTNVTGALNATDLAQRAQIPLVVFTSSISVYGPSEVLLDEESPLEPCSSYGRSKRLAETIRRRWLSGGEANRLVIVRPGVVFGPGDRGNYTNLVRALRGGIFVFPGRRDVVKSGGYVDELLNTMEFAISRGERSVLYNFAYPEEASLEAIVEVLSRKLGRRSKHPNAPIGPMLAAARVFELLNAVGLRNPIHRDRISKLVQSTKIAPNWLTSSGYSFGTDLESAIEHWHTETSGRLE